MLSPVWCGLHLEAAVFLHCSGVLSPTHGSFTVPFFCHQAPPMAATMAINGTPSFMSNTSSFWKQVSGPCSRRWNHRLYVRASDIIMDVTPGSGGDNEGDYKNGEDIPYYQLPRESKLRQKMEQMMERRREQKIRLRRKRIRRKRRWRKQGRWPPSKLERLRHQRKKER